jgi:hypothetical protein
MDPTEHIVAAHVALELRLSIAQVDTIIYLAVGIVAAFWAALLLAIALRRRGQ